MRPPPDPSQATPACRRAPHHAYAKPAGALWNSYDRPRISPDKGDVFQGNRAMTTKRLLLSASLAFAVISSPAFAGTTISDQRYWPDEAHAAAMSAAALPQNAFDSVAAPQRTEQSHRYEGGPRSIF